MRAGPVTKSDLSNHYCQSDNIDWRIACLGSHEYWRDTFRKFDVERVECKRDHAIEANQCDKIDDRRPTEGIGELLRQMDAWAACFDKVFRSRMNQMLQIVFVGNRSARLQCVD